MVSPLFGQRFLSLVGALGLAGCATSRTYYPEWPGSSDTLARDPCSVKREPEIIIRGSERERAEAEEEPGFLLAGKTDAQIQAEARISAEKSVATLQRANPIFLCGLEKIEFLGNAAYRKTLSSGDDRPSSAYYDHENRVLRIRLYGSGYPVVHEVGHHVHNTGHFAATIRQFFAQSWVWDDKIGDRVHRCEGSHCFFSKGAAESPAEDWARTFENVLLHPAETVIRTNLNFEVVGRTALQTKVDLIFDQTSLEKPVKGAVSVGAAQILPPSTFQVLAGSGLYLFDAGKETMTSYALKETRFIKTSDQQAKADHLFKIIQEQEDDDFSKIPFLGHQIGSHIFVMGREEPFAPRAAHRSYISIWELDPAAGDKPLIARRHYFTEEKILGGFLDVDGKLGYFTFSDGRLHLKTRAPGSDQSAEERTWALPEKMIPLHVIPLNGSEELAVLAYDKNTSNWRPEVTLLRLTAKKDQGAGSQARRGDSLELDSELWRNLKPPVRLGDHLIFPTYLSYGTTLGILVYDLSKDKFTTPTFETRKLPEEFKNAAGRLGNLQLARLGEKLYLIATVQNGNTLIAPIGFKI